MALTDSEVQSLRFHAGYGNIDFGAYPYTPDGFLELFQRVIAPNLETGPTTAGHSAVVAGNVATVTVNDITGIIPRERVLVDVGDDAEIVVVKTIAALTFTAKFAKDHPASGYPVATMSGETRLRILLGEADRVWQEAMGEGITSSAGLKQLGRGKIEWFPGGRVLVETNAQYRHIIEQISSLVRVEPGPGATGGRGCSLAGY